MGKLASTKPIQSSHHMLLIIPVLFALYVASATMFAIPMPPPQAPATPIANVHYLSKGVLQVNPQTLATRFIPYGRGIEDRRKGRGTIGESQ